MSIYAFFLVMSFFFGLGCIGFSYFLLQKELQFSKDFRDYTIPILVFLAGVFNLIPPIVVTLFLYVFSNA